MNTLVRVPVPGTGTELIATKVDGKPYVSLRHACAALGIDVERQRRKLSEKPWAVTVLRTATGADGKSYAMTLIDRRTLIMWLATIDSRAVAEKARPVVEAFQREAADALDSYFSTGIAINPRASHSEIIDNLCKLKSHGFDSVYLDATVRMVMGRMTGTIPELDAGSTPLYASQYLEERGHSQREINSLVPVFGKRVKDLYVEQHGCDPDRGYYTGADGRPHPCAAYAEIHRPIFDAAYAGMKAEGRI